MVSKLQRQIANCLLLDECFIEVVHVSNFKPYNGERGKNGSSGCGTEIHCARLALKIQAPSVFKINDWA